MKNILKICGLFLLIITLASCGQPEIENIDNVEHEVEQMAIIDEQPNDNLASGESVIDEEPELELEIPSTYDTPVLFASQAPFSNWNLPYQEACEESSLIMAYKYFANEHLDKTIMDNEIKKLVAWEIDNLGFYTDTTLEEVEYIANEYFELKTEISNDVSVENIKKQLVLGNLIIVPASGRDLDNPNFTDPGPIFHMLVIRGYDRNEFITNDPGTRNGLKFKYKYSNLIDSIHDLYVENGAVFRPYEESISDSEKLRKMRSGPQRMLIIKSL